MPQYARYRAPVESGQKLVSPSWDELRLLVRENRAWRANAGFTVLGQPMAEFSHEARREVLAAAGDYVASYARGDRVFGNQAEAGGDAASRPVILTGHQPEMFHPGVWVKNFVADELARRQDGVALNLIIDGDACHATSIRIPAGSRQEPRFGMVEYDRLAATVPWEERRIVDRGVWRSFADRVGQRTAAMLPQRMLDAWWPTALERGEATGLIGPAIAQARHLAELGWGRRSLELPQSRLCGTMAFRRFVCHLLLSLPRFVEAYNTTLAEYRRAHGIRNHAQPVPNLHQADGWLEAPLWLWSTAQPTRRPAFIRFDRDQAIVSDRQSFERSLPLAREDDADAAVEELGRWERDGCKLRSRALITTMFARLALADLFIHGIGGAKYDEATDGICERFFGAAPPAFGTVSGTLHLPLAQAADPQDDVCHLQRRLRELAFHPERFISLGPIAGDGGQRTSRGEIERLINQKRHWVNTPKNRVNAAERHRRIEEANVALRERLVHERQQTELQLQQAVEQARAVRVLNSREYAFCLFPPKLLKHFLLDFSAPVR